MSHVLEFSYKGDNDTWTHTPTIDLSGEEDASVQAIAPVKALQDNDRVKTAYKTFNRKSAETKL